MTRSAGPKNKSTVAVAYDGLCTFEFGVAAELFGLDRPELDVDWYDFAVVATEAGPLRATGGMTVHAPHDLRAVACAGTIVLPGWRDIDEDPPVALLDALRTAHANGARIMSICSGVFILAASGLLDGKAATTHWRYTDALRSRYPLIEVRPDVLYVDNGAVLTSAGSAAGLDLGLHLIRRDYGADIANSVARRLVVAPQRDGGQAQFITVPAAPDEPTALAPTMAWALEQLDESLSVASLARHAAMSPRTFARRFRAEAGVSPHQWLTQQRVLRAQQLLETTSHSIETVAHACGFGSAATLRHHFQQAVQTTPTRYRSRFNASLSA
jgi:AraC family transcriptional regulator, transcriptional activator FtrA